VLVQHAHSKLLAVAIYRCSLFAGLDLSLGEINKLEQNNGMDGHIMQAANSSSQSTD